jgi:DNA-binding NtrC family response regulator
MLDVDLLPAEIRQVKRAIADAGAPSLSEALAEAELQCVARALEATGFQKERARQVVGYGDRHTMRRRIVSLRKRYPDIWRKYPSLLRTYGETT